MKNYFSNIRTLAALLMAGAAFAACSSDENVIEQPASPAGEQVYTLTFNASKGGDTRALALDDPSDPSSDLHAVWEVNDVLVVTIGTTELTSDLKCTEIKTNGDAVFTGTIKGEVAVNDALTLHYHKPASAGLGIYANQTGTLASAEELDYATATVTVASVDETTHEITLNEGVADFEGHTQTAVLKLTLQDGSSTPINATSLTMSAKMTVSPLGEMTQEIATFDLSGDPYSTNGAGVLYFTLPQVDIVAEYVANRLKSEYPAYASLITSSAIAGLLPTATLTFTATEGTNTYSCFKTGYKFDGGKYYAATLTMYPMAANATAADIGKQICTDGHIHAYNADAGCTATRVALITYVGSETGASSPYTHGLAFALEDVSNNTLTWDNSGSNNGGKTAAVWCSAWNTSKPVANASWMLPSKDQWNNMVNACKNKLGTTGSSEDLRTGFGTRGGTDLRVARYWSSTEYDADATNAWNYTISGDTWAYFLKNDDWYVRSVLAF